MFFGKHFASMYEGSMYGAGALKFAIMGYVIGNQQMDRVKQEFFVELNAKHLAGAIGEDEADVRETIEWLCQPDPESRNKAHEGRRLIRQGQFSYLVVSGWYYYTMKKEEDRREQNRVNQAVWKERHPEKVKRRKHGQPITGEVGHLAAERRGESPADPGAMAEEYLKEKWGNGAKAAVKGNGEVIGVS